MSRVILLGLVSSLLSDYYIQLSKLWGLWMTGPSEHPELLTQWHSVTSQMTWTFWNTAVKTSNLTHIKPYYKAFSVDTVYCPENKLYILENNSAPIFQVNRKDTHSVGTFDNDSSQVTLFYTLHCLDKKGYICFWWCLKKYKCTYPAGPIGWSYPLM